MNQEPVYEKYVCEPSSRKIVGFYLKDSANICENRLASYNDCFANDIFAGARFV